MARQTRSQRRARRQEQARAAAERPADGRQFRAAAAAPVEAAPRAPGGGIRRFVSESVAELKKVEWPTQHQLITGTTVVLIACAIVGFYLWIADVAFHRLVRDVLLK